jgi:predicted amidohydrolase
MKVAGVQMDLAWEDPTENFRRAQKLVEEAGQGGARLVVLPEMFATGFSMDAQLVAGFAAETRDFLRGLSREMGLFLLAGYAEPADPRPANACSIFDPDGKEILHYRKLHPFSMAGEDQQFVAGESLETVAVEGVRVSALICYDLRFPEPFRAAAADTDLFCVLANWPVPRRHHWSRLLEARAIENQAYVLGVNRVGSGEGMEYTGDSALRGPMGEEVAAAEPGTMAVFSAEVDPGEVSRIRGQFGFLDDRRPDMYQDLEAHRSGTSRP